MASTQPTYKKQQSSSASYKTAREFPEAQPAPEIAPPPVAAPKTPVRGHDEKAEAEDILEMAAQGGPTTIYRKSNPLLLNSTKPNGFQLQIAPSTPNFLDPPRGKILQKFRDAFAEHGHKKSMSYFTQVGSMTWLSVKERAELIHSMRESISQVPEDPNDRSNGHKIQVHGGTALVLGTWETNGATVGDVAALVAGDPVKILPELRGDARKYNIVRGNSAPVVAAKVLAATQFDLDFEQTRAVLELEKTICELVKSKLNNLGWFTRNYRRTEESLSALSDQLNTDICNAVYTEAQKLIKTDVDNVPAALEMVAFGSQLVPNALYILASEISNRDAAIQDAVEGTAEYVGKIVTKVAIAAATHGVSVLVDAATGDASSDAGGKVFKWAVGRALPNELKIEGPRKLREWISDARGAQRSLATRPIDATVPLTERGVERAANRQAAEFLGYYVNAVEHTLNRLEVSVRSVRVQKTAAANSEADAVRKPGAVKGLINSVAHLFKRHKKS